MFDLATAEILGGIAFLMRGTAGIIYIISILKGQTKPHFYTWLVFAILTAIAFFAQISDNAGPGAWMMGITALSCLINALLALKFGEQNITRSDKYALTFSLSAIIPWLLTDDPLGSVILVSLIDGVGLYPTIRKTWHKPYEESLTFHIMATITVALSIFALTNFTWITALYPTAILLFNLTFITVCVLRRRAKPQP